jgi:hypothetical protein
MLELDLQQDTELKSITSYQQMQEVKTEVVAIIMRTVTNMV